MTNLLPTIIVIVGVLSTFLLAKKDFMKNLFWLFGPIKPLDDIDMYFIFKNTAKNKKYIIVLCIFTLSMISYIVFFRPKFMFNVFDYIIAFVLIYLIGILCCWCEAKVKYSRDHIYNRQVKTIQEQKEKIEYIAKILDPHEKQLPSAEEALKLYNENISISKSLEKNRKILRNI